MPRTLKLACAAGGVAVVLFLAGLGLGLLPENSGPRYNGLPLGEYDFSDLFPSMLFFGALAVVLAGVSLGRGRLTARQGRAAKVLVTLGLVPIVLTVLFFVAAALLCSGGCD